MDKKFIEKLNKVLEKYTYSDTIRFKLDKFGDSIIYHNGNNYGNVVTDTGIENEVQVNYNAPLFSSTDYGKKYSKQELISIIDDKLSMEFGVIFDEEYYLNILTEIGIERTGQSGFSGWNDISNIDYVKSLKWSNPLERVTNSINEVIDSHIENIDYPEAIEVFGIMQEFNERVGNIDDLEFISSRFDVITKDIVNDFLNTESVAKDIYVEPENAYFDMFESKLENAFDIYHEKLGLDVSNVSMLDVFDMNNGISFRSEFKFIDDNTSMHFLDYDNWSEQVNGETLRLHLEWMIEEGEINIEQYPEDYKLLGDVYKEINNTDIKPYFTGTEENILTNVLVKDDSIQLTYLEKNEYDELRYDQYVTSLFYDEIVKVQSKFENPTFMDYVIESDVTFNNVVFESKELDGEQFMTSNYLNTVIKQCYELDTEMEME